MVSMTLIAGFTVALVFALTVLALFAAWLMGISPFVKVKKVLKTPKTLGVPEKVELNPVSKPVIEHSPSGMRFSPTHYIPTGIDPTTGNQLYKFVVDDEIIDVEFSEHNLIPVNPLKTITHEGEDLWKIQDKTSEAQRLNEIKLLKIENLKLQEKLKANELSFEEQLKRKVKEDKERRNIIYGSSGTPYSKYAYSPYRYGYRSVVPPEEPIE